MVISCVKQLRRSLIIVRGKLVAIQIAYEIIERGVDTISKHFMYLHHYPHILFF